MNTIDTFKEDLKTLGVRSGDTLFLRISYKALGDTEGGPKTFLDALLDVVGPEGTILLTAFPKVYNSRLRLLHLNAAVSAQHRPKSITGALSNVAMHYPESYMSSRLDFPFVVIGQHAEYLTKNHGYDKAGYWILEEAIEKYGCKCLRIGGEPFIGTTHMALSHTLREKKEYQTMPRYGLYVRDNDGLKWRENNNVVFCPNAMKNYLPEILGAITINEGHIGGGYAILTDMKKSLSAEEDLLRSDLHKILCSNPGCCLCQTTFSFSPSSKTSFLLRQIKSVSHDGIKKVAKRLRFILKTYMLFTKKND